MARSVSLFLLCLALAAIAAYGHTVEHVVVLMEENRSFDHLFGWAADLLKIDGLTGKEFNPVSTLNASSERIYVTSDAEQVAPCDPDHATYATTDKIFGLKSAGVKNATECMCGFYEWESQLRKRKDGCAVMKGFKPEKLPVLMTLAKEYAIMDKMFCSLPGPTWPNRQFAMAASSGGSTETFFWFQGEAGKLFPQKTIFDQMEEAGKTWANYYVDTPWELFMEKLAKSPENIRTMDSFYSDCQKGTLPTYSFINPRSAINVTTGEGSNDMHPDHDVALAEKYIKDVYEAVRNSPAWNKTLLIVTFDEHGGFYDHVHPPRPVPPPDDNKPFPDFYFGFDRLGIRIPTILISPWIKKGSVISEPPAAQRPFPDSQYELTSIMSTVRKVLNISHIVGNLTRRDAWAATFEHALNEQSGPRADCPARLPDPVPAHKSWSPEREAALPQNGLQSHIMRTLADLNGLDVVAAEASASAAEGGHNTEAWAPTQGASAEWIAKHHRRHRAHALRWKQSLHHHPRPSPSAAAGNRKFRVAIAPMVEWYLLVPGLSETAFDLNRNSSTSRYATISTRTLTTKQAKFTGDAAAASDDEEDHYCLTLEAGAMAVTATPCFSHRDPVRNRERTQLWDWRPDATIRPATMPSYCVTTHAWENNATVSVEPCASPEPTVQQHFLYFGPGAPGNPNQGFIQFGNGIYSLAVVPADLELPFKEERLAAAVAPGNGKKPSKVEDEEF